jgi:hypothetical protein
MAAPINITHALDLLDETWNGAKIVPVPADERFPSESQFGIRAQDGRTCIALLFGSSVLIPRGQVEPIPPSVIH